MDYNSKTSFASNVVKGRIAETLVEEMFKKSGYKVYRFGYEAILQNISQSNIDIKDSETKEKIRSIPDFVVVSPKGSIQLIEVKYSADGILSKLKLKKYLEFWNEARVILVSSKEPYFSISYIRHFMKNEKLYPLENDKFTTIDPEIIKKFSEIVKEYFKE
ncbi:MAG: hypothetical protein AABW56_02890 [Nanoarchaeota archaeon]